MLRPLFYGLAFLGGLASTWLPAAMPDPQLVKDIAPGRKAVPPSVMPLAPFGDGIAITLDHGVGLKKVFVGGGPGGTDEWVDVGGPWRTVTEMVAAGGKVFFAAEENDFGTKLYVTEGTPDDARLVKEMHANYKVPSMARALYAFKDGVVFVSESGVMATALWWTDGSVVRALSPLGVDRGDASGQFTDVEWLAVGDHFYFTRLTSDGYEICRTDGTMEGTTALKEIAVNLSPRMLGNIEEMVFFSTGSGPTQELWKTDGTPQGTLRLKALPTPDANSVIGSFVTVGSQAFFLATVNGSNRDIWVTDGSEAGTRFFQAELPGVEDSGYLDLVSAGGRIIASYYNTQTGLGVSAYDPQNQGRQRLFDGRIQAPGVETLDLVPMGNMVCFAVPHSSPTAADAQLWVTDGILGFTREPATVFTSPEGAQYALGSLRAGASAVFFFSGSEEVWQLWRTDFTDGGTHPLLPLPFAPASSHPQELTVIGDDLYFSASTGESDLELWRSDGTEAGTVHLPYSESQPPEMTRPQQMTALNGHLFFSANLGLPVPDGGPSHRELFWLTPQDTLHSSDLHDGHSSLSSKPDGFIPFADRLFFAATSSTGRELWATDHPWQPGSVSLYSDLNPDPPTSQSSSNPAHFTEMDGWLYFTARPSKNSPHGVLHRLSSVPGSLPEKVLFDPQTPFYAQPHDITQIIIAPPAEEGAGSVLYCLAGEPSSNRLFRCRNGEGLTGLTSAYSYMEDLRPCGKFLAFTGQRHDTSYRSLYRFNGIAKFDPLLPGEEARLLEVVNETLYFTTRTPDAKYQLECMRVDGSGRTVLRTLPFDPVFTPLAKDDHVFYFSAITSITDSGSQIWWTTGTALTTQPIAKSYLPASEGSPADHEVAIQGDTLYFAGNDLETGRELYSQKLVGEMGFWDPDRERYYIQPVDRTNFGPVIIGQSRTVSLELRNLGTRPIQSINLSSIHSHPEFEASFIGQENVLPGADAEIQVTYTPIYSGWATQQLELHVTTSAGTSIMRFSILGEGRTQNNPPVFHPAIAPVLENAGQPATLRADIVTHHPVTAYQWKREGVPVSDQEVLTIPSVQAADAGLYTLTVTTSNGGTATSSPVPLIVILPPPVSVSVVAGQPVSLTCNVAHANSVTPFYTWLRNGEALIDVDNLSGVNSPTLLLDPARTTDAAEYSCMIFYGSYDYRLLLASGSTRLHVLYQPEVTPPAGGAALSHYVGEDVSYQLPSDQPVDSFTARGLPPGLSMDSQGLITGRPAKALPVDADTGLPGAYEVTVTATNAGGTGQPVTLRWIIHPLLPAGTYYGLLDPLPEPAAGLGSQVRLTTTARGSLSGQLIHEGKKHRFSTYQLSGPTSPAQIPISRGRKLSALTLILDMDSGVLTLTDAADPGPGTTGLLRPQITPGYAASIHCAGAYTASLQPETPPAAGPFGSGYLTATITKTGLARWKGKLADGTPITGSSSLTRIPTEDTAFLPLHKTLYKLTGSLHGWVQLIPWQQSVETTNLSGSLSWFKAPLPATSRERLYKDGIPRHTLTLTGGEYTRPAKGRTVMNLRLQGYNATLHITGPNVPSALPDTWGERSQRIGIQANHKAIKLRQADYYQPLKTLTFRPATGTYKGTLYFPHPEDPQLHRSAPFEGVILAPNGPAPGYFLLPDLPLPKTSPIQSGPIEILPD